MNKVESTQSISILEVNKGSMDFCVLGTSPLICNRMSEKAMRELLAPKGRKTTAEKAASMKHDPIQEFRDSPYQLIDESAPTLIGILPTSFKGAMRTAALDVPGAKKAQIGRLVYVHGEMLPVWGIPKLFMAITRSADINRTPDVRTRAILPEWACRIRIDFLKPIINEQSVANLLAAAGFQSGVGDWRQEKGSGNYGSFRLVSENDPDFVRITSTMGREEQIKAFDNPITHDKETSDLLAWFETEAKRRGMKVAA
jgi:hypothetical protein